jgi:hypothetical protein
VTLRIEELPAIPVLAGLHLIGDVHRLAISRDPELENLDGIVMPAEVERLDVIDCAQFASLDGIENTPLPKLRILQVTDLEQRLTNLDALMRPTATLHGARLVDQLDKIVLGYRNLSQTEIGNPLAQLASEGFEFSVSSQLPPGDGEWGSSVRARHARMVFTASRSGIDTNTNGG